MSGSLPHSSLESAAHLAAAGRFKAARKTLKKHLGQTPGSAAGYRLLGKIEYALQVPAAGEKAFAKALALAPRDPFVYYDLGTARLQTGHIERAIEPLERAAALAPDDASILFNLSHAILEAGRPADVVPLLSRLSGMTPQDPRVWLNLGNALVQTEQWAEGAEAYQRLLDLRPMSAEALFGLGLAHYGAKQFDAALDFLRRAYAAAPTVQRAHTLATLEAELNHLEDADATCRAGLSLPDTARAETVRLLCLRAGVLYRQGRMRDILDDLAGADREMPDTPAIMTWLATAMVETQQTDETTIPLVRRALDLQPDDLNAATLLGTLLLDRGDLAAACDVYRQALTKTPDNAALHSNLCYALRHRGDVSPEEIFAEHRRFGERQEALCTPIAHPPPPLDMAEKPLRIGILSPDLRRHPVSFFFEPIARHLRRPGLTTVGYFCGRKPDDVTERYHAIFDQWRTVTGRTPDDVATLVRDDDIDILIDLAGHTAHNMLPVFARKPAPIQITWIGYPATTGMTRMDFRLTSEAVDPPKTAPQVHTERLIYPRRSIDTFHPPEDAPGVTPPPSSAGHAPTFASFNRPLKISQACLTAWGRILLDMPEARFLMVAGNSPSSDEVYRQHFRALGIAPERVTVVPRMPLPAFLDLMSRVDVALDPFPYSGGTTTLITSWMGVPSIALGRSEAGPSGTAETMRALRLHDLVADTPEDYADKAIRLARDTNRLTDIRAALRARMILSPMMDGQAAADALADQLRQVWRDYVAEAPGQTHQKHR